jgi:hypothetical protein
VVALLAGGVALGPATTPELVVMTAAGPQADAVVLPGDGVPGVSMTVVVSPGPGVAGSALDQLEGHSRQPPQAGKGAALKQVGLLLVISVMACRWPWLGCME